MSKDSARRIEEKEAKRINNLGEVLNSGKAVSLAEIVDSETLAENLQEEPLLSLPQFNKKDCLLPTNSIFYSKMLMTLCPDCDCNKEPELIKPYLERNLIIPILASHLTDYNPKLLDLVFQYPYIGTHTFRLLKFSKLITSKEAHNTACPHCFEKKFDEIIGKVKKLELKDDQKRKIEYFLFNIIWPALWPTGIVEMKILDQIDDVIDNKNFNFLSPLANQAFSLYNLRTANVFEATPQVAQDDLSKIGANLGEITQSTGQEVNLLFDEKKWISQSLDIMYSPDIAVEEYLDIIEPRRKKINKLIQGVIAGDGSNQELSLIQDNIWKINNAISTSKSLESLNFITSFVSDNSGIIFGMLSGGLIGYVSGSFAGCGIGSLGGLAGTAVSKFISKKNVITTPKYPRKTIEWMKEKIESVEERALSKILSKDIKTIQVWSLRKKLKKDEK